jgi:23S rRNA pseudouridine1911/1915/1917 synthase
LKFLLEKLSGKSKTSIKSLLTNKQIFVDGKSVSQFNYMLNVGNEVTLSSEKAQREIKLKGLKIIYEDTSIIVILKESGLLSIATDKETEITAYSLLIDYVKDKDPRNQIFVLHRLDRETSGLMMFAKDYEVKRILQTDWQESVMERCYIAVVEGVVKKQSGSIISWLTENKNFLVYSSPTPNDGQKAITHYKVLKTSKHFSLLEVKLETGRKNQIRVHLQDIGHSVIGDKKYGATHNPINRLGLHAYILAFKHPISGETLRFETKIPKEFENIFK